MKKFILFLGFILVGTLSTLNSYAIDEPTFMGFGVDALFSDEKGSSTNSIDKCIIRSSVDTSANDSDECLYLLKDDKKSASQGGSSHLYCNNEWCANNTLVFAKDDVSRGGFGTTNFSGPVLMRCETGLNNSWEKVGGIDQLPKCGNSAPEKTITVNGKTVRCKRKEKRGNQEYCIGIKSGDICVDSGNGKPAEKPKEAEQKKEAKTEPIEENNKSEETCDTNQGYEYNPVSKKCVRTEAGKAEEKKEEPKKAAPTKRKPVQKAEEQKSGKAIFRDYCKADGGALDMDDTRCTVTDTAEDVYLDKYKEKFKKRSKCGELKHQNNKIWSIDCTISGFEGTWFIGITNITCKSGTFNKNTGECDTTNAAAEEPAKAENAPATNGSVEPPAEEAAPAAVTGEDNSNDEWAALRNDAERIVKAYKDQKTKLENK